MAFAYEAMDSAGRSVAGVLDVTSIEEANKQLHARDLFVTRLNASTQAASAATATTAAVAPNKKSLFAGKPGNTRDLLMLAQQMTMMLRAGSRVVPALDAISTQIAKPQWHDIVKEIQANVESGSSLSTAIAHYPEVFSEGWRAIISAGESTGRIAEAFEQLSVMTKQQQQVRTRLIGALVYPLVLVFISVAVMCVLMFFVLPRFDDLYSMLSTPLPGFTQALINTSRWAKSHTLLIMLAIPIVGSMPAILIRMRAFQLWLDRTIIRCPIVGQVVRQIILARIFRIWGTAVSSNVPLLESLELSREGTRNVVYRSLMSEVLNAVREGSSIASVLDHTPLVPKTMASAIGTGEQSGQLGESLLFLAGYMEDENNQALATLTRMVEPVILVLMGATVGVVAVSLFLPLFDLTAAMGK